MPVVIEKQKTEEAVLRIHAQKITLDDVMGTKLPPEPSQELNDSTIEGIDANQNGIRDDVELPFSNCIQILPEQKARQNCSMR